MLDFCGKRAPCIVGLASWTNVVSSASAISLVYRMYRAAHCDYLVIPQSLLVGQVESMSLYFPHRKYGSWLPGSCTGRCGFESPQCRVLYKIAHSAKLQTSLQNKDRPQKITTTFSTEPYYHFSSLNSTVCPRVEAISFNGPNKKLFERCKVRNNAVADEEED